MRVPAALERRLMRATNPATPFALPRAAVSLTDERRPAHVADEGIGHAQAEQNAEHDACQHAEPGAEHAGIARIGDADAVAERWHCYPFEVNRLIESLERILTALAALSRATQRGLLGNYAGVGAEGSRLRDGLDAVARRAERGFEKDGRPRPRRGGGDSDLPDRRRRYACSSPEGLGNQ